MTNPAHGVLNVSMGHQNTQALLRRQRRDIDAPLIVLAVALRAMKTYTDGDITIYKFLNRATMHNGFNIANNNNFGSDSKGRCLF